MKQITSSALLTLLVASTLQQAATINGCTQYQGANKPCAACYLRPVSAKNGCGAQDLTSNCLLHAESFGQPTRCTLCKKGFATSPTGKCVQGFIPGCVLTMRTAADGVFCTVCGSGLFPAFDWKSCVPVVPDQAIENCVWTGVAVDFSYCLKCSPGFVASQDAQKSCVPAKAPGCLTLGNNGRCQTCNVFSGYSMQADGTCKFTNF